MCFTITRILARAPSRRFKSIVTLFFTWLINAAAISLSMSSPIACTALPLAARANRMPIRPV